VVGSIPSSLDHALRLAQVEPFMPVAGGTDVMIRFKGGAMKHALPPLFIGDLKELKGVWKEQGYLCIGACETYANIIKAAEVPVVFKKALSQIGSPAIRNQGTLGGNICNASPAGDALPLLFLFKAEVVLASKEGERVLPLEEFITGPGQTGRKGNELLIMIRINEAFLSKRYFYVFEKMGNRKADAISKASFALRLLLDDKSVIDMDAAFGAMGPRVTLLNDTIKSLILGKEFPLANLDTTLLRENLFSLLTPIDDQRSTAKYRKTVALNLLSHYLTTNHMDQYKGAR